MACAWEGGADTGDPGADKQVSPGAALEMSEGGSPPLQPRSPPAGAQPARTDPMPPPSLRPHLTHPLPRRARAGAAAAAAATHLRREGQRGGCSLRPRGRARGRSWECTHRGREQGSRTRAWRESPWTCGRERRERDLPGTARGPCAPRKPATGGRARPLQFEQLQTLCATSDRPGDARTQGHRACAPPRVPHLRGILPATPECGKHGSVAAIKTGGAHEHCAGGAGGG